MMPHTSVKSTSCGGYSTKYIEAKDSEVKVKGYAITVNDMTIFLLDKPAIKNASLTEIWGTKVEIPSIFTQFNKMWHASMAEKKEMYATTKSNDKVKEQTKMISPLDYKSSNFNIVVLEPKGSSVKTPNDYRVIDITIKLDQLQYADKVDFH